MDYDIDRNNWTAPAGTRLPDFIVCGAMKSGTTTLHRALEQHPKVFFAEDEIHFFDIDDLLEHPNFSWFKRGQWFTQRIEQDPHAAWQWYSSHFQDAGEGQLKGEDSTVYLASRRAAGRIALQEKPIKLIAMLRNPVDRAYSHYWHLVRSGRATYSFEDTLRYEPYTILNRSLYVEQLERLLAAVGRERVMIVVFENLIADRATVLNEVCDFLGIEFSQLPHESWRTHMNKTRIPRFARLQQRYNAIFRKTASERYIGYLPFHRSHRHSALSVLRRAVKKAYKLVNPSVVKKPPAMNPSTREHLELFFRKELRGLNELVGEDVLSLWLER